MALNEELLALLIKQYAVQELASRKQVTVSALVTSDELGNVSIDEVKGPLSMDDDLLTALSTAIAKAVVLHIRTMGQADPNTGKIF